MARSRKPKYKVRRIVAQAAPTPTLELGSEALAARRRALNAARKARALSRKQGVSAKEAAARAERAAKQAEYRRRLAILREYGTYAPVSQKLTRSRRGRINQKYRQLEDLLRGAAFAQYPTRAALYRAGYKKGAKAARRSIRRATRKVGGTVTRKGVFAPRSHPRETAGIDSKTGKVRKARVRYDKATGLWEVVISRQVRFKDKRGRKKIEQRITVRPLAGASALAAKERQIKERWDRMPALKKNQRLRFIIEGRNISNSIFRSMDALLDYARKYRKKAQQQAEFINSLTIQVVQRYDARKSSAKFRAPIVERFRVRNLRSGVSPDILEQFEEEVDFEEGEE